MVDTGKAALYYIKWILEELGIIMLSLAPVHADNQGAIRLANSQQPRRRTHHVEMKHFVILQWTDDKFINFINTKTDENQSDSLRKLTPRTKFYEHTDIFTGRRKSAYIDYCIESTDPHSPTKTSITHYLSLSTYRNNPIINLLQSNNLDGFDSASVA